VLPRAEPELAAQDRDRLRRADERRPQVRVGIRVVVADVVLVAAAVGRARDEAVQQRLEVGDAAGPYSIVVTPTVAPTAKTTATPLSTSARRTIARTPSVRSTIAPSPGVLRRSRPPWTATGP
jgi:hypothetical protein